MALSTYEKEKAIEMSMNGYNAREIANKIGTNYEETRSMLKK